MSSSLLSSVVVCSLTAFLFIDSWHRHGHYTVPMVSFTFALLVMLTERLISKGESGVRWPAHQPRRNTLSLEKLCPGDRVSTLT